MYVWKMEVIDESQFGYGVKFRREKKKDKYLVIDCVCDI